MALFKCVECGKEVSDKVKTCLNCGDDIQKQIRKSKEKSWKEMSKGEKTSTVLVSLFIGFIVFGCLKACISENTASPEDEKKQKVALTCKHYLKKQLAVPDSMKDVDYSNVMDIEPGTYELNLSFKAKNYFGQEIPFSYHCVVKEKGESLYVKKVTENQY